MSNKLKNRSTKILVEHDDGLASSIRREEINEAVALSKARRLEREFGKTIRLARKVRTLNSERSGHSAKSRGKSRSLNGATSPILFRLPVVTGRRGSSPDGKSTFTYKITPIPKTRSARTLRDGTKIRPGAAAEGARYAAGGRSEYLVGDRTQLLDEGGTLVLSNIDSDNDPEKCAEFFELVEKHERNASLDKATIDFKKSRWLWRRVVEHPACDPALAAAYRDNPDGKMVVELCRGAATLREVIQECDLRPKVLPSKQEVQDRADGITWKLGRGGRTQWRVMVSFPTDFTSAQRHEGLGAICAHFEAMGCMYMGVIHQAAASNDRRNNHCHIDLYDRPCRQLSGDEERDLANVSKRWKQDVQRDYKRGLFEADVGRWDFEVTRTCTYASGNKRPVKVFRANKSEAMRKYSMPKDSRRDIAAILNGIALRDFGRELVDHETNEKRGIDKKPDRPLGPSAHALEGKGWATDVGLDNEQRHAESNRREIARRYQEKFDELERAERDFLAQTTNLRLLDLRKDERKAVTTALHDAQHLARLKHDAALLQLEFSRQLSSAYLVIKTSSRVIRLGEDKRGDHAERRTAARAYWRAWVVEHAEDVRCLREMKMSISKLEKGADIQLLIDRAVVPVTASEQAAQARRDSPNLAILPSRRMSSLVGKSFPSGSLNVEVSTENDVASVAHFSSATPDGGVMVNEGLPCGSACNSDQAASALHPPSTPQDQHFGVMPTRRNIMTKSSMAAVGTAPTTESGLTPPVSASGEDQERPGSPNLPLGGTTNDKAHDRHPLAVKNDEMQKLKVTQQRAAWTNGSRNIMTKSSITAIVPPLPAGAAAAAFEPLHSFSNAHDGFNSVNPEHEPDEAGQQTVKAGNAMADAVGSASQSVANPIVMNVLVEKQAGVEQDRKLPSANFKGDGGIPLMRPGEGAASSRSHASVHGPDSPLSAPTASSSAAVPQNNSALRSSTVSTLELARRLGKGPDPEVNEPLDVLPGKQSEPRKAPAANHSPRAKLAPETLDRDREIEDALGRPEHLDTTVRFEREMLVHIIRTERIRLEFKDGNFVIPDHPRIPEHWRRQSPAVRVELERDQRKIEGELRALVHHIRSGRLSANDPHSQFMLQKFGASTEVQRAMSATKQLALQQSLAARPGIGF